MSMFIILVLCFVYFFIVPRFRDSHGGRNWYLEKF